MVWGGGGWGGGGGGGAEDMRIFGWRFRGGGGVGEEGESGVWGKATTVGGTRRTKSEWWTGL